MEELIKYGPILQGVVIPVVIAICGYLIQDAIKQKEINSRLVELSIQILNEKPMKEKVPIRMWAVDVINKYSKIKLDDRSKSLLIYNAYFITNLKDDTEMRDDAILAEEPRFIETPK